MYSKMMLPIQLTKILYSDWQGSISISSQDSQIYGKCLNGPGSVTFKNGNKYEGDFYNGLLSGKGKFMWANGIVYQGEFTDNRITGKGVYSWPDGSIYEGEVKDGLRHGFGNYKIDEATYEGEWKEGKKQGKGKIIFKSGSIFQGDFKNDLKHGYGKMYYYPSGNYFEGQWENDMKEGKGTMNWTDLRQKYFGEWHKNCQHGWGVHIWLQSKGEGKFLRNRYEGNWANGVRQGYGVFHYANGAKYEGFWLNNMKQGFAFYTNQNGKVSHLMFDKDRMLKSGSQVPFQESNKKVPNKKEVQPNAFSQSLQIDHLFAPFTPNLEALFNLLLRNNTQLKTWYKGLSNFYDQQSQYSFCLNSEGIWKMIRALKILGDISLADLNRGLRSYNPDVEQLLKLIDRHQESVDIEDIFYSKLSHQTQNIDFKDPKIQNKDPVISPLKDFQAHSRSQNFLFREFVHLLVWIAYSLNPSIEKPQKSVEGLLVKITPMLQNITKSIVKPGTSDNISQNMSSVSKSQKSISPHIKTVNQKVLNILKGDSKRKICQKDIVIKLRELLGYGMASGVFAEPELMILQKVLDKYLDGEILGRARKEQWENSTLSTKILNIMNYELIEYQFTEILYFLVIKKLPTHKETEENKAKYQVFLDKIAASKPVIDQKAEQEKEYAAQPRFLPTQKAKRKLKLIEKRKQLQKARSLENEVKNRLQREALERQLMAHEDKDIKEEEFDEEESELEI